MTAQAPERILLDGRPRALYADPLDGLTEAHGLYLGNPNCASTGNYRGYIGTWQVQDRRLCLTHLHWEEFGSHNEVPVSEDVRAALLQAAGRAQFPIHAHWFSGSIRISIGRRLIYSHRGWSHWFERERVMRFVAGELVRDHEVDTRAMLERWLRRHPEARGVLDGSDPNPLRPLTWFERDEDDWTADWWPPGYAPAGQQAALT